LLTLFIGGVKSGKSKNAEKYILENSSNKPIYLATNEFFDAEMQERVAKHKTQRSDAFFTLEEPLKLSQTLQDANSSVLVECVSMWINNMLYHKRSEADMMQELQEIVGLKKDIVFVINDVSSSVVASDALTRKFVDINGRVSQFLATECDAVFHTVAGISVQIK